MSLEDHTSLQHMPHIYRKWRFLPSKIPLLSSVTHSHKNVHKAILKTNTCPYKNIQYTDIHGSYPYYKFHPVSDPDAPSPQNQFSNLVSKKFTQQKYLVTPATKTSELCAIAFYNSNNNDSKQIQLFPETDVLAAEELAIYFALHYCTQSSTVSHTNILIISDSLSAIKQICRPLFKQVSNTITLRTQNLLQHISLTQQSRVSFLWIPRHRGISGNKIVDALAKDTTKTSTLFPYVLHSNILQETKTKNYISWAQLYEQTINHHSSYYKIQPHLPTRPWYSRFKYIPRHPVVLISPLRLNHNRLPANLARFIPDKSPLCTLHPLDPQTASLIHVLFICSELNHERNELETKLLKLKVPRPWSHITLLHSPSLPVAQALYSFFSSIKDKFTI